MLSRPFWCSRATIGILGDIQDNFEKSLVHESISEGVRYFWSKRLRYYFGFGHKYQPDLWGGRFFSL